MLVSDRVDDVRRARVAAGREPRPEYLLLESAHNVDLLDWSALRIGSGRSPGTAIRHCRAALLRAGRYDVILSDGEHVGIPMALAKRTMRARFGHVVIGHHVTVAKKRPFFRVLRAHQGMSRLLVHSRRQLELARDELGFEAQRVDFVPYAVDQRFWAPVEGGDEPLIVSAGREHRDFSTLASAVAALPVAVRVAAGSVHSPRATWTVPERWPDNVVCAPVDREGLRSLYGRAAVVVVPLLETDFQAGVTTVLEAMAMAKPVVVTGTAGQRDIVGDGVTGLVVPPSDPRALVDAVRRLLEDHALRRRLGGNARQAVLERYTVDAYAARLAEELEAAAG